MGWRASNRIEYCIHILTIVLFYLKFSSFPIFHFAQASFFLLQNIMEIVLCSLTEYTNESQHYHTDTYISSNDIMHSIYIQNGWMITMEL